MTFPLYIYFFLTENCFKAVETRALVSFHPETISNLSKGDLKRNLNQFFIDLNKKFINIPTKTLEKITKPFCIFARILKLSSFTLKSLLSSPFNPNPIAKSPIIASQIAMRIPFIKPLLYLDLSLIETSKTIYLNIKNPF